MKKKGEKTVNEKTVFRASSTPNICDTTGVVKKTYRKVFGNTQNLLNILLTTNRLDYKHSIYQVTLNE